MILPESSKAVSPVDGVLVSWVAWVLANGVPELIAIGTLILIVLRIVIAVREIRK